MTKFGIKCYLDCFFWILNTPLFINVSSPPKIGQAIYSVHTVHEVCMKNNFPCNPEENVYPLPP